MQIKKLKFYSVVIILIIGIFAFATPVVSFSSHKGFNSSGKTKVAPEDEIFSWIEDLCEIGDQGRYGYRMPGTGAYWEGAEYVLQNFEESGLEDTFLEPVPATVCFPDEWSLTINTGGDDEVIPSYFLRYTAFTDPEELTTEMVYVGTGSQTEFDVVSGNGGVEGKIVLVDILGAPWPRAFLLPFILFEWDPDNTFANDPMATENWPLANLESSYQLAATYGAAGYVGIMTCMPDYVNQYLHWYADGEIPGLTVSPNDGDHLKDLLATETVEATMILTGEEGPGTTYNVYGSLPGKTDDIILVLSHHDGWATNEASGVSVVMALAKYFAQIPRCFREKTLMFVSFASHFGKQAAWDEYECLAYNSLPQVACAINIEMIGKQIKVIDGEFVETGLIAPRGMFLSGPFLSANEYLLSYASEAIVENDMVRTSCLPAAFAVPGEGAKFHELGVPTINYISHNAPQFTQYDTLDTVAKDALVPTTEMFIDIINDLDKTPTALLKWVKTEDGRGIKAYPDLREDVWEMKRAPYGPFDKIGIHRLVKEGIEPHGVYFMLPGTWSSGEQMISNPPTDTHAKHENHSHAIYLANRGWEVYSIDYRTHFVDQHLTHSDLSFMIDWGWNQWISDIKEAVNLAKAVSGEQRIYLAGDSFGGSALANYASMYWEEDLKGIIPRDGGTVAKYPELVDNLYDLPSMINGLTAENWSREVGSSGAVFLYQYAVENPDAPAVFPPWEPWYPWPAFMTGQLLPGAYPGLTIFEWAAYGLLSVSNMGEGFGDPAIMVYLMSRFDRYWPTRLGLDSSAIIDWDNCPYVSTGLVPYDFDDNYYEIDVPFLGFLADSYYTGEWRFQHQIANPDFIGIMLPGYRHLDVFSGEFSVQDVSQPTYEWLMSHKMLVGFGKIWYDGGRIWGDAAIYINASTIEIRIDGIRVSWVIFVHCVSKKHEFYKGENDFGRITVIITKKGLAIASGRKVFFIGCKV
ncbi:MAG: M28 family peptidase [Candidatus Lokiarchaeota archaeon]|nr:M28 family peptidase [Candidatus Lokiarchaeota archaeon]